MLKRCQSPEHKNKNDSFLRTRVSWRLLFFFTRWHQTVIDGRGSDEATGAVSPCDFPAAVNICLMYSCGPVVPVERRLK